MVAFAQADDEYHAETKSLVNDNIGDGHFQYAFDTSNGIYAQASGDEHAVHGEFHYTGKDGVPVQLSYTADENGYQPQSDLLPTPPPIPDAILRAIAYIESHPQRDEKN